MMKEGYIHSKKRSTGKYSFDQGLHQNNLGGIHFFGAPFGICRVSVFEIKQSEVSELCRVHENCMDQNESEES